MGCSPQNLKYMRKFAEEYKADEIDQQAVDQIPWGHIVILIYSVYQNFLGSTTPLLQKTADFAVFCSNPIVKIV